MIERRPIDSYDLDTSQLTLRDRLVFLMRGGMVKRFHNAAVLQENTVAHHSWGVAWFCYLLTEGNPSANLLLAALAHDQAEQIVGDVPAPGKRLLGIRPLLHAKESEVLSTFGLDFESALTLRELRVLRLADSMDGLLFVIRERMFGNKFAEYVFDKYHSYVIDDLETPADRELMTALVQLYEDAIGGSFAESK